MHLAALTAILHKIRSTDQNFYAFEATIFQPRNDCKSVRESTHLSVCGRLWLLEIFKCSFRFFENCSGKQTIHTGQRAQPRHTSGQLFIVECLPISGHFCSSTDKSLSGFWHSARQQPSDHSPHISSETIYLWIRSNLCCAMCATHRHTCTPLTDGSR